MPRNRSRRRHASRGPSHLKLGLPAAAAATWLLPGALLQPAAFASAAGRQAGRPLCARRAGPDLGSTIIEPNTVDGDTAWARIDEVRQRLRSYKDLPNFKHRPATENPGLVWWFLRDRRLDVQEATEKLVKCLRWRQKFRVEYLGPDMFLKEIRAGKGYVHRHPDVVGRPVIVAIARRHNVFDRSLLESSRMCTWMLESAMKQLDTLDPPPQGAAPEPTSQQIEQALGIFDLREFSPLQADLEVAGFLIEVLYNYYPGRTGKVLLVGAPDLFRAFWENIKPLLGRYSSLADFVSVEELRKNYFKPGLEPPEFAPAAPASNRQAVRSAFAQGSPRFGFGVGFGNQRASLAFSGLSAAALAWCLPGRRRQVRQVRTAMAGSLVGLGTRCIQTPPVDAEDAADRIRQLQRYIPETKFKGRPAAQNRALLWWFLRDRQLDVAEAAEKLNKCLQWRQEFGVDRLGPELFIPEMRARKAYLHAHRDVAGRPVLVVIARRHNILERRLKESCSMCTWYMEQLLERMSLIDPTEASVDGDPNQIEQAVAIVDLSGFSPLQADLEFVCFMIDVIHNYYPRRFARVLLVDAPDLFASFWKSVCPMLHHYKDLAEFTTAREVGHRYFSCPEKAPPELLRSYRS